jgi:hypothetical protein
MKVSEWEPRDANAGVELKAILRLLGGTSFCTSEFAQELRQSRGHAEAMSLQEHLKSRRKSNEILTMPKEKKLRPPQHQKQQPGREYKMRPKPRSGPAITSCERGCSRPDLDSAHSFDVSRERGGDVWLRHSAWSRRRAEGSRDLLRFPCLGRFVLHDRTGPPSKLRPGGERVGSARYARAVSGDSPENVSRGRQRPFGESRPLPSGNIVAQTKNLRNLPTI